MLINKYFDPSEGPGAPGGSDEPSGVLMTFRELLVPAAELDQLDPVAPEFMFPVVGAEPTVWLSKLSENKVVLLVKL